ncbi:MAG: M23 family metallopeptidase [bacterium]|nr:M23 family metallopeptidase [bacterium]
MKTRILALLFILLASTASVLNAQTFSVLNSKVSQGDVSVIRIYPQFQTRAQGLSVCIFVEWGLNKNTNFVAKHYPPNQYGEVLIGIPVDTKPGKYSVYRIECGRGTKLDSAFYVDLDVSQKQFPETKIGHNITSVDSTRRKRESTAIQDAYAREDTWTDYTQSNYRQPLDMTSITDEFGKKRIYLNGQTRHGGVDLKATHRTPIKAVNSGVVLLVAKNFSLEGNMIILDHGSGVLSLYLHLSKMNVKQGEKVNKGEIIGLSGSTGSATGPHLHFIIKVNNTNVDPLRFIDTMNQYIK